MGAGFTKIMRPAEVCSTLVTATLMVWPINFFTVFDHDHGAVVQVAHALVVFLALLDEEDLHLLAGQHHRF